MNRRDPPGRTHGHVLALGGALGLALAGCTLGGADEGEGSPYDDAVIEVMEDGVADGVTPVEVEVSGSAGARLTVVVGGGASFLQPDANTTNEKTVFLADEDGDGTGSGTAFVTSRNEGVASVFFKVDPLLGPVDISFYPVRMAAATRPTGFAPGMLEHGVCVALNTAAGKIEVSEVSIGTITTSAEISATAPSGLDCPAEEEGGRPWAGYAELEWISPAATAQATVRYMNAEGETLLSDTLALAGVQFAGYAVSAADPVAKPSFVSIQVTFTYADVGSLVGIPAAGIEVEQRFIPVPEAEDFVLGSSSGGTGAENDPLIAGADGKVTVFFNPGYPGTYAWFVTPQGGSPEQLTVEIPEPPAD